MENEFYYRQELELKMEEFLTKVDHEFGYVPDKLARCMADAAWAVIKNNIDMQTFLREEGYLKE